MSGQAYISATNSSASFDQSTPALQLNQTALEPYINHTMVAMDFNQTTLESYLNQTMAGMDINQTMVDQNSTTYDVVVASTPLSGLTYTLFGLTCLFTILGVLGNGLILISMFKVQRRSQGHSILVGSLAIFDMIACLTYAITQPCTHDVIGVDIRALSTIGCKVSWAVQFPAMFCSTAIVVIICLERYLAVWFPHKMKEISSKQNMIRAVWMCAIPIVLVYATMAVLYCEVKDGVCHPNFEGSVKSTVLNRIPDTTAYSASIGFILIASMLILVIFTPLIIVKLYKQWSARRRFGASDQNQKNMHFATSVKLVAVAVAHITLIGSPSLAAIIFGLIGIVIDENIISGLALAILLNHSINFLLYNIFDAEFRRNILALIGCTNRGENSDASLCSASVPSVSKNCE